MSDVKPLDPRPGEAVPFHRLGRRWHLGSRPTRVRSEIAENDNGEVIVTEFGTDGSIAETTVVRERAA